jgi:hypothetical protein
MDGVFFNKIAASAPQNEWSDREEYRRYYVFGLVPNSKEEIHFTAIKASIQARGGKRTLQNLRIKTQKSPYDVGWEILLAFIAPPLIGFLFQPWLWNYRAAQVDAQVLNVESVK